MLYNKPYGAPGSNDPYINGNPSTGTAGSIPPAESIEYPQREIVAVIQYAFANGLLDYTGTACATPSNSDLTQLLKAIFGIGNGSYVTNNFMNATSIVGRTLFYTSSGAHNFVVPAGVTKIEVQCWGGGGAGGASANGTSGSIAGNGGAGGGAGGYCYKQITGLTPLSTVVMTVGAAGVSSSSNGGNGGASSAGAFCTAGGGAGGSWGVNTIVTGGAGGTATGGDFNIVGGGGGNTASNDASVTASYILNIFLRGGIPAMGIGTVPFGGTGSPGQGYAAGGTGATGGSSLAGGNGAGGLIIVRW